MLFNGHQRQNSKVKLISKQPRKGWYYLWCGTTTKVVYVHKFIVIWTIMCKEEDPISHGAHVAGTAVGNASQPSPTGNFPRGSSRSSAQRFCASFQIRKVDKSKTLFIPRLWKTKLGADTINASLELPQAPSMMLVKSPVKPLMKLAKAGVTTTSCFYQYGNQWSCSKPLATNTWLRDDRDTVSHPNVISVASINSLTKHVSTEASLTVVGSTEFPDGKIPMHSFYWTRWFRPFHKAISMWKMAGWKLIWEIRLMYVWFWLKKEAVRSRTLKSQTAESSWSDWSGSLSDKRAREKGLTPSDLEGLGSVSPVGVIATEQE